MPSSARSGPAVISSLSLHDALPIYQSTFRDAVIYADPHEVYPTLERYRSNTRLLMRQLSMTRERVQRYWSSKVFQDQIKRELAFTADRKSTRLNSSHVAISYAVFCSLGASGHLLSLPTRRSSDLPKHIS